MAGRNPFTMPSDEEVFALRDEEKLRKEQERKARATQKIWDKGMGSKARPTFRQVMGRDEASSAAEAEAAARAYGGIGGLSLVAAAARERRPEKEKLSDLISKKREMFLVQMALDTKRLEIKKLEDRAQQREEALAKSEAMLEEDVIRFDAFLKQNDTDAVEAMRKAEAQTKLKTDKVHEIKKLNSAITSIKSEMSKFEEQLEDCRRYRAFLDRLTPPEWVAQQREAKAERRRARRAAERARLERIALEEAAANEAALAAEEARAAEEEKAAGSKVRRRIGGRQAEAEEAAAKAAAAEQRRKRLQPRVIRDEEIVVEDSGDELPMYFEHPSQLLAIFASLEESNLFLIQNSQETEEALEELRQRLQTTKMKKEDETRSLRAQIDALRKAIRGEEEKARALLERAAQSTGVAGQEDTLADLNKKVAEVYQRVFGELDPNLSTLQMLAAVESKLEELLGIISAMPADEVEAMQKAREKERRQRVREEKLEISRKLQEERVQRSLRRAQEPVQKRQGKPIMARSQPLHRTKRATEDDSNKLDEEDDVNFYLGLS